jgi:hypothetical protein
MKGSVTPESGPAPRWRNWILFAALAALAAVLYVAIMVKISGYGY